MLGAGADLLPELEIARDQLAALRAAPQVRAVLAQTERHMATIEQLPQTSYSDYRHFVRDGDRGSYEEPYFLKRTKLAAAALRLFLGAEPACVPALTDI